MNEIDGFTRPPHGLATISFDIKTTSGHFLDADAFGGESGCAGFVTIACNSCKTLKGSAPKGKTDFGGKSGIMGDKKKAAIDHRGGILPKERVKFTCTQLLDETATGCTAKITAPFLGITKASVDLGY